MAINYNTFEKKQADAVLGLIDKIDAKIESEIVDHDFQKCPRYRFTFKEGTPENIVNGLCARWNDLGWNARYGNKIDPLAADGEQVIRAKDGTYGVYGPWMLEISKPSLVPTISPAVPPNLELSIEEFVQPLNLSSVQMALLKGVYAGKRLNKNLELSRKELLDLVLACGPISGADLNASTAHSIVEACQHGFVNEAFWNFGRRGGSSTICSAIAAYEVYLLLTQPCPQTKLGLDAKHPLEVLCFSHMYHHFAIKIHDLLKSNGFIASDSRCSTKYETISYRTMYDMMSNNQATVVVSVYDTDRSTMSLAGYRPCFTTAIFDNLTSFDVDSTVFAEVRNRLFEQEDNITGYEALLIVTGADNKGDSGWYQLYRTFKNFGAFCAQIPSAVNPNIKDGFLEDESKKDPVHFATHFGAKFRVQVHPGLEPLWLKSPYGFSGLFDSEANEAD